MGRAAPAVNPSDERFEALFALAAFAGLRLGEAAAVQAGDIDFLHRTLGVRRNVRRAGQGRVEVPAPKYRNERALHVEVESRPREIAQRSDLREFAKKGL